MPITQFTAVGISTGLLPSTVMRVVLQESDLAVWRDSAGAVHAARNRCPHRGMRVSFGFVRGDRLVCPYHGWAYNAAGRCVAIPANPSVAPPKSYALRAFACMEQAGLIYVAEAGTPDTAQVPGNWRSARTLFANVGIDRARSYMEARAIPAIAGRADTFHLVVADTDLLVALQPMDEGLTGLHVAVEQSQDRLLANRLTVHMRCELESLVPEVAGPKNTPVEVQAHVN